MSLLPKFKNNKDLKKNLKQRTAPVSFYGFKTNVASEPTEKHNAVPSAQNKYIMRCDAAKGFRLFVKTKPQIIENQSNV